MLLLLLLCYTRLLLLLLLKSLFLFHCTKVQYVHLHSIFTASHLFLKGKRKKKDCGGGGHRTFGRHTLPLSCEWCIISHPSFSHFFFSFLVFFFPFKIVLFSRRLPLPFSLLFYPSFLFARERELRTKDVSTGDRKRQRNKRWKE
jgi:hypothetical protein